MENKAKERAGSVPKNVDRSKTPFLIISDSYSILPQWDTLNYRLHIRIVGGGGSAVISLASGSRLLPPPCESGLAGGWEDMARSYLLSISI